MAYSDLIAILDTYEPDTPPSMRYHRLVDIGYARALEMRDPNEGSGGGRSAMRSIRGGWCRRQSAPCRCSSATARRSLSM